MRTPAPSEKRMNTEKFRKEECSRLFFQYVANASDMLDGYEIEMRIAREAGASADDIRFIDEQSELVRQYIKNAEQAISQLPEKRDRDVLAMRFIQHMDVPEMARKMSYSHRSIHTFINDALEKVYRYLPPGWSDVYSWKPDHGPEANSK